MAISTILSDEERERLRAIYDALPSNVPKVYESYPVKRKKLAKIIHEIQELMNAGEWEHWYSWTAWDPVRMPITYCFVCLYPVKLVKFVNPMTGKLLKLKCDHCDLVHFDSKYD